MDEQKRTGFILNDSAPSAQVPQVGNIGQQPLQEIVPMPSLFAGSTATIPSTMMAQPLRKSCEFCRLRKKKCDGPMASDRAGRCRFCASKGLDECVYTERKSSAPKTRPRSSKRPQEGKINGADRGDERGMHPGSHPAIVSVDTFEGLALKRCRLSASPATGLVGMQENVFLSNYFECMALLPLTDESEIRSAMVAMMQSVLPPKQRELHSSVQPRCNRIATSPSPSREGAVAKNGSQSSLPPAASTAAAAAAAAASAAAAAAARAARVKSDAGASTCALWCAVAMGALVHGWPTSSVLGYVELAREALKECFDMASVGVMRAFTMMAFLSNFIGEPDKFQKYLMFARGMRRLLPPRDIPKEAIDMLLTADSAVVYSGMALTVGEMEDFCQIDDSTGTPVDSVTHKSDRCQLLLNVHHRLDQAFFKDMTEGRGILSRPFQGDPSEGFDVRGRECDRPAPAETRDDPQTEFSGVGNGAEDGGEAHRRRGASEKTPLLTLTLAEGKDPEIPPLGEITQRVILDELPELERLAADVSWPEIKTGVGGLIFNIRMCLLHYLRGDVDRAQNSIRRVADIFLQWPGLCRFSPWSGVK